MATSACRASVVYVTVPDDAIAKKLSHGLVEAKLAACVNIIPGETKRLHAMDTKQHPINCYARGQLHQSVQLMPGLSLLTACTVHVTAALLEDLLNVRGCTAGLQSVYLWQGEITADAEILLMIKTRSTLVTDITAWVKQNHPYEECEVISTGIQGGSKSYIDWVLSSTC